MQPVHNRYIVSRSFMLEQTRYPWGCTEDDFKGMTIKEIAKDLKTLVPTDEELQGKKALLKMISFLKFNFF